MPPSLPTDPMAAAHDLLDALKQARLSLRHAMPQSESHDFLKELEIIESGNAQAFEAYLESAPHEYLEHDRGHELRVQALFGAYRADLLEVALLYYTFLSSDHLQFIPASLPPALSVGGCCC